MGSFITLTGTDGFNFSAYQAEPEGPPRGAVVVIQEIFGVNSHIRSVTDRYAAAGYLAIAPAVFDRLETGVELGYAPEDMQRGMGIVSKLDFPTVMADVVTAGRHVAHAGKVGIVGYCFGGGVAATAAIEHGDVFSAASSYYGGGTPDLVGQLPRVAMMMHYGERDAYIPLDAVAALQAAWPEVEFHIYPADHGFHCDQRATFHAESAAMAQARTFRFFAANL